MTAYRKATIVSDWPKDEEGNSTNHQPVFTSTDGTSIHTHDTAQCLTDDEVKQLRGNGFTVNIQGEE